MWARGTVVTGAHLVATRTKTWSISGGVRAHQEKASPTNVETMHAAHKVILFLKDTQLLDWERTMR